MFKKKSNDLQGTPSLPVRVIQTSDSESTDEIIKKMRAKEQLELEEIFGKRLPSSIGGE
jgi:ERCC4-type nuclease